MLLLLFINLKTNNFLLQATGQRAVPAPPCFPPNCCQRSRELSKAVASGFCHCPHMGLKARSQH